MATQLVSGIASGVLSVLSPTKVTNGNMELDSDWTDSGATSVRSSDQAHSGTYSRKLTLDGSGTEGYIYQLITGLTAGKSYKITAWFYGEDLVASNFRITMWNSTNIAVSNGSWVKVEFIETAAGAVGNVFIGVAPTAAENAGKILYIDNVSIKELTFLTLGKTELVSGIAQIGSSVSASLTLTMGTEEYVSGLADAVFTTDAQLSLEIPASAIGGVALHTRNHISISGEEITHGIVKGY